MKTIFNYHGGIKIKVNGKKVDPESPEGKKIIKNFEKGMDEFGETMNLFGKTMNKLGKTIEEIFR